MLKYIISIFIVFVSCNTEQPKNTEYERTEKTGTSSLKFNETEYNFGTITSGEIVSHRFIFKNTGNNEIFISKVLADCGCTIIDYEKRRIKPGEETYIETMFNSAGFYGLQIKKIHVYANTIPEVHELSIYATIK